MRRGQHHHDRRRRCHRDHHPGRRWAVAATDLDADAELRPADPARVHRRKARPDLARAGRPAPAAAQHHPTAVVEGRKTPGCGVDPGPAPGRHPGPAAVVEGRPAGRHHARLPDAAVLRVVEPVTVAVQVLPAGHAGGHMAGADGRVIAKLVAGHPVGEGIALDRRPGIAGGAPARVLPQVGAPAGRDHQQAVGGLETQFATPDGGLGGRCAGLVLALQPVVAGPQRQPAALGRDHRHQRQITGLGSRQAQRQGARLQPQGQLPVVELLQRQVDIGTQAHGGAADPQFGPGVGAGAQAVTGGQGPVAQRLLGAAKPGGVVAVVPAHLALHGAQPADDCGRLSAQISRQLAGQRACVGPARQGQQPEQPSQRHARHAGQPALPTSRPCTGAAGMPRSGVRAGGRHRRAPPPLRGGLAAQRPAPVAR